MTGVGAERPVSVVDVVGLLDAIDQGRLRFLLQPVVSAASGQPAFHECLLRVLAADGSLVAVGVAIDDIERRGGIWRLDRSTLELAVRLLETNPDVTLSLNVSALTVDDAAWLDLLEELTGRDKAVTGRLIVEITETAAIRDLARAADFVGRLQALGCRAAIDDFGAGHTSLKILAALGVNILKIDGALVETVTAEPASRDLIRTLVSIAKGLGLETVAEHVGDEATAHLLREAGITYLQGHFCGEPVAADAIASGKA